MRTTSRRNVLLALVIVAAGFGAVFGTQAATQETATRDAPVEVVGDDSALLALEPATVDARKENPYATKESGELRVNVAPSDGDEWTGVNPNATVRINNVFSITNQGSQGVGINITSINESSGNISSVTFGQSDDTSNLGVGDTTTVDIVINTTRGNPGAELDYVQITADAEVDS